MVEAEGGLSVTVSKRELFRVIDAVAGSHRLEYPANSDTLAAALKWVRNVGVLYEGERSLLGLDKPGKDQAPKAICFLQELNLALIQYASVETFDGAECVRLLRENRGLWKGVVAFPDFPGIALRDISTGQWNTRRIYIEAVPGQEDALAELSTQFGAEACGWIGGKEACNLLGRISVADLKVDRAVLWVALA